MHNGVLYIATHVVFILRDTNNDHLAGFPTLTSTVYSRVLDQMGGLVKFNKSNKDRRLPFFFKMNKLAKCQAFNDLGKVY